MSVTFNMVRQERRTFGGETHTVWCPVGDTEHAPAFNLANANARDLLGFVGLPDDELLGVMGAEEVIGACLIALGLRGPASDPARAATVSRREGCVTMVECPRAEGYLHERAHWLLELAERASAEGCSVGWG